MGEQKQSGAYKDKATVAKSCLGDEILYFLSSHLGMRKKEKKKKEKKKE